MRLAFATVAAALLSGLFAAPALAFGMLGKTGEHMLITRWALSCDFNRELCFAPRSASVLAGDHPSVRTPGAVGAPDVNETEIAAAHCDDTDFLSDPHDSGRTAIGGYPRPFEGVGGARTAWLSCHEHLRQSMDQAVRLAKSLLDEEGHYEPDEVRLTRNCITLRTWRASGDRSIKCQILQELGRVLHGAQDFHAHTNWNDALTDPPFTVTNPPGLAMRPRELPALLDFSSPRAAGAPLSAVPPGLTGGCFTPLEKLPGPPVERLVGRCKARITHDVINKDVGTITLGRTTRDAGDGQTARGSHSGNFGRAAIGAVYESRRQWTDLMRRLLTDYGRTRGSRMACALAKDRPRTRGRDGCLERILICREPPPGAGAQPRCRWFSRDRDLSRDRGRPAPGRPLPSPPIRPA